MQLREFVRLIQGCYPDPPGVSLKSVNGLQVEASEIVRKAVFGVFLNDGLIARAVELGADAVVCHHGYSGEGFFVVTGPRRNQLKILMGNHVSVIGIDESVLYHAEHPTASLLAAEAGLSVERMLGSAALCAEIPREDVPTRLARLLLSLYPEGQALDDYRGKADSLAAGLGKALWLPEYPYPPAQFGPARVFGAWGRSEGPRRPCRVLIAPGCHSLQTIDISEAGADLYVVGEVREHLMAEARELGITVLAVGHYYSARPGVLRALSEAALALAGEGRSGDVELVFAEVPSTL